MRTNLKKFMVFVLSLVMVVTAVPVTTFAYDVQVEPPTNYRMDNKAWDYGTNYDWQNNRISMGLSYQGSLGELSNERVLEYDSDMKIRMSNFSTADYYSGSDDYCFTITPCSVKYISSSYGSIVLTLEGDNYFPHYDLGDGGWYDDGNLYVVGDLTIQGSGTLHVNRLYVRGNLTIDSGVIQANYICVEGSTYYEFSDEAYDGNMTVNGGIVRAMACYVKQQYSQYGGFVALTDRPTSDYDNYLEAAALSARCVEMNGGYLSIDNVVTNCYRNTTIAGILLTDDGTVDHGAKPETAIITGDEPATDHTSGYAFWMLGGLVEVNTIISGSSSEAIALEADAICVEAGTNKNYRIGLFGGILHANAEAEITNSSIGYSGYGTSYAYPIKGIVIDGIDGWKDPIDTSNLNSPNLMSFVTNISGAAPAVNDFASNSYDFTDSSFDYTTKSGVGVSKMSQTFAEQFYPNQHDVALKTFHTGDTIRGTYLGAELANDYVLQDVYIKNQKTVKANVTSVAGTVFINGDYTVASGKAFKAATPSKWYSVATEEAYYLGRPTVIIEGDCVVEDDIEDVDLIVLGKLTLSGGAVLSKNTIAMNGVEVNGSATVSQGAILTAYTNNTGVALKIDNQSDLIIAGNVTATADSTNHAGTLPYPADEYYAIELGLDSHVTAGIKAEQYKGTLDNGILTLYGEKQVAKVETYKSYENASYAAFNGFSGSINGIAEAWCSRYTEDGDQLPGMHHYSVSSDDGELYRHSIVWNYINTGIDCNEVFGNSCEIWDKDTVIGDKYSEFKWNTKSYNYRAARFELGYYPVWVGSNLGPVQVTYDNADNILSISNAEKVKYLQASALNENPQSTLVLSGASISGASAENATNSNYFKYRRLGLKAAVLAYEDLTIKYTGKNTISNTAIIADDMSYYGIFDTYSLNLVGEPEATLDVKSANAQINASPAHGLEASNVVTAGIGSADRVAIIGGTVVAVGGDSICGAYTAGIYCCNGFDTKSEYENVNGVAIIGADVYAEAGEQKNTSYLKLSSGIDADALFAVNATVNAIGLKGAYGHGVHLKSGAILLGSEIDANGQQFGIEVTGIDKRNDTFYEWIHGINTIQYNAWTGQSDAIVALGTHLMAGGATGIKIGETRDLYAKESSITAFAKDGDGIWVGGDFDTTDTEIMVEAGKESNTNETAGIYAGSGVSVSGGSISINRSLQSTIKAVFDEESYGWSSSNYSDYGICAIKDVEFENVDVKIACKEKSGVFSQQGDIDISGNYVVDEDTEEGAYNELIVYSDGGNGIYALLGEVSIENQDAVVYAPNGYGIFANQQIEIGGEELTPAAISVAASNGIYSLYRSVKIKNEEAVIIAKDKAGIRALDDVYIAYSDVNIYGDCEYGIKAYDATDIFMSIVDVEVISGIGIYSKGLDVGSCPNEARQSLPDKLTLVNVTGSAYGLYVEDSMYVYGDGELISLVNAVATADEGHAIHVPYLDDYGNNALQLQGHMAMVKAVSSDSAIVGGFNMEDGYIYATSKTKALQFAAPGTTVDTTTKGVIIDNGYKLYKTSDVYNDKSGTQHITSRTGVYLDMGSDSSFGYKTVEFYYPSTVTVNTEHDIHSVYEENGELDVPLTDRYVDAQGNNVTAEPYTIVEQILASRKNFKLATPVALSVDNWFKYTNGADYGTECGTESVIGKSQICTWAEKYSASYKQDDTPITSTTAILDESRISVVWKNKFGNKVITDPIALISFDDWDTTGITKAGATYTFKNVTVDLTHHSSNTSTNAVAFADDDTLMLAGYNEIINNGYANASDGIYVVGDMTIKSDNNGRLDIQAKKYGIEATNLTYHSGALYITAEDEAVKATDVNNSFSGVVVLGATDPALSLDNFYWNTKEGVKAFVPSIEQTTHTDYAKVLKINNVNVTGMAIRDDLNNTTYNIKTNDGSTARVITLYAIVKPETANQYVKWTKSSDSLSLSETTNDQTVVTVPAGLADGNYYVYADTVGVAEDGTHKTATYTITVTKPSTGGGGSYGGGGGGGSSAPAKQEPTKVETVWKDVDTARYYYDALQWAFENDIIEPESANKFGIGNDITRAELFGALYKAAGSPKVSATATIPFTDVAKNSKYYNAVVWAYTTGLTNGAGAADVFAPNMELDRAQIVTILWRYSGSKVQEGKIEFTDVEAGRYYEKAVDWSTANGIINGTGDGTTFSPEELMLKESAVTMLYRKFVKALF